MNPDDLKRSAAGMIRTFGADAEQQSAAQAEKFAARGADQAAATWQAITRAITELRSKFLAPHSSPEP